MASRYDEFGRIKKKFRGTEADKKAREEAALARLHGTSGSGVRGFLLQLPPLFCPGLRIKAPCHLPAVMPV